MAPLLTKFLRLLVYSYLHPLQFVHHKIAKVNLAERKAILTSNIVAKEKRIKLVFSKVLKDF